MNSTRRRRNGANAGRWWVHKRLALSLVRPVCSSLGVHLFPVHLREADVLYSLRWLSQEERKEKEERKAEKKKCEFCKRFACIC